MKNKIYTILNYSDIQYDTRELYFYYTFYMDFKWVVKRFNLNESDSIKVANKFKLLKRYKIIKKGYLHKFIDLIELDNVFKFCLLYDKIIMEEKKVLIDNLFDELLFNKIYTMDSFDSYDYRYKILIEFMTDDKNILKDYDYEAINYILDHVSVYTENKKYANKRVKLCDNYRIRKLIELSK